MPLAAAGPSALWYLTRATGAVALILLTVSLALGIANVARLEAAGWPRFVVEGLHRNASLLALALLIVHIVTSLLDPFAGIRVLDALVPFTGAYRPIWLGLGAFASDLLIAVALTSVVRRRLGHGTWRATHWLAYLCWPVAVVHAAGTGSDIRQAWMLALLAVCVATVVIAVWARVGFGWPTRRGLRTGALVASIALPAALVAWLPGGPLAKDWARRAGTPVSDLASASATTALSRGTGSSSSSTTAGAPPVVSAFSASVHGTARQLHTSGGQTEVEIALHVEHATLRRLAVHIYGQPVQGGVQMSSSAVSIGTSANPSLYSGTITALDGTNIGARVVSSSGRALALEIVLRISGATTAASGTVAVTPQ